MKNLSTEQLNQEFDRQVGNLLKKDYPKSTKVSEETFLKHILPLKEKLPDLIVPELDLEKGYLPFVIVVKSLGHDV